MSSELFRSAEQTNFYKHIAAHLKGADAPLLLEGGTGLGKTRAYLAAIAESDKSVAIVLPTNQLIDQLLNSADMQALGLECCPFRRADLFDDRKDYLDQRDEAKTSRVLLCTAASVIIDQRLRGDYNGVTTRDYILFDEADQLPAVAALQRDLSISAFELHEAGISLTTEKATLERLLSIKKLDAEVKAKARLMTEVLENPAWYQKLGKDEDGGIALHHKLPGLLLSKISNRETSAFVSATLKIGGTFDDFKRSMGIAMQSRFSTVIEPEKHGDIEVFVHLDRDVAEVIQQAAKPCLVATPSHDLSAEISALVPGSILRTKDETTAQAAQRVLDDGVLVATGAWAGLDTPIKWASVVVPKIPFDRPTIIDEKIESHYVDVRNVATRRMRQVVGRGLRTPDAHCEIHILDERYKNIGEFLPKRFRSRLPKETWSEGKVDEHLKKERQRLRAYRARVLEKFGVRCVACDLQPPNRSIIDVHHLNPISQGQRDTTLEDLVPLCPTCHRWAHTEDPPISIEKLKNLRGGTVNG